jgi:hypothetical protein
VRDVKHGRDEIDACCQGIRGFVLTVVESHVANSLISEMGH